MNDKIMIAMSGGVDSAVSALLAAKNRTACGVTMQLALRDSPHAMTAKEDIKDAQKICAQLNIPHVVADLRAAFKSLVIDVFTDAYKAGNKHIKFGALLHFAAENGYDRLATGHYARIERDTNGRFLLRRATDTDKDQTYMLYTLTQEVLARVEFPLGYMHKSEVRCLAEQHGFAAAKRRESQDICFVPDGEYAAFIQTHGKSPLTPGNFLSLDGRVLGQHRGVVHYTIGQRKGLGIAFGKPMFVVAKSATDNTVTLGENEDLFTRRLTVKNLNFIPFDELRSPMNLFAKARYRQQAAPVRVEQTGQDELVVEFEAPQRAISPGQSLVLYDGDYVIGGGKIQ